VDYYDLGLIQSVRKGQPLVVRTPPIPGVDGQDVCGRILPFKQGKDAILPRGKNTIPDQDGINLYAVIDGSVTVKAGKVNVDPVFELKGNVDFSTGDISFVGNVIIQGMVTAGFKVNAEGDVEIRGLIENAEVTAGGNVQVKGGITGNVKCIVKAGGNIQARFVENARLEAGQDVLIKEAIMQAQVKAGGSVKVNDKRAIIVGGTIQAFKEVESKVIGSQLATQTVIEVGINPIYREEHGVLSKEFENNKKELTVFSQNINKFQQSGRSIESMDESKRIMLLKQLDDYKRLHRRNTEVEERIAFLEKEFRSAETAKIRAVDIVYPGVKIVIGQSIYIVNDPVKSSSFVLIDGDVRIGPLR
jgi:uncharacterized protein (DUF342 family)